MKKLFTLPFLMIAFWGISQNLVTFDFAGASGSEANWASNTNASGFDPSSISRGSGVTGTANADRFNSTSWTTGGLASDDYVTFSITPQSNVSSFTITGFTIKHQRSGTGPVEFSMRTSVDGFTSDVATITVADNTNINTWAQSGLSITSSVAVEIRIYGYLAEAAGGTWGPGEAAGNDIVVTGTSILPVELTSINVSKNGSNLLMAWQTASELNNSHFCIERSGDGVNFREIGTVSGNGTSYGFQDYVFVDENPLPGKNYYRLKQVDFDGGFEYSKVTHVDFSTSGRAKLYPTLADDFINLAFSEPLETEGELSIYDFMGRLVDKQPIAPEAASMLYSVAKLQAGHYSASIQHEGRVEVLRFVKR